MRSEAKLSDLCVRVDRVTFKFLTRAKLIEVIVEKKIIWWIAESGYFISMFISFYYYYILHLLGFDLGDITAFSTLKILSKFILSYH